MAVSTGNSATTIFIAYLAFEHKPHDVTFHRLRREECASLSLFLSWTTRRQGHTHLTVDNNIRPRKRLR